MKALTPSQKKTLAYVREHGRVMADAIGTGYSVRSARSLARMGLLKQVEDERGWPWFVPVSPDPEDS